MHGSATASKRVPLLKRDRPRWIDKYIDYFGEAALPPAPERRGFPQGKRDDPWRRRILEVVGGCDRRAS
jgi:hypothetical protein